MQLCEQYRPACWGDVIGQDKAARIVAKLRPRGLAGRAYWISGPSGTGKTTIALLIAHEVADPEFVEIVSANGLTPKRLYDVLFRASLSAFGKGGRAVVINEAHGLSTATIRELEDVLEGGLLPKRAVWIFTTTNDGQESLFEGAENPDPLLSRCTVLRTTSQALAKVGPARLLAIATAEGLRNGDSDDVLLKKLERIIHDSHGNLRAAFQAVEAGALL